MGRSSVESLERLAAKALAANGVQHSWRNVEWDISGRCERPVTVAKHSRATENVKGLRKHCPPERPPGMEVTLHTECRRCPTCMRKRAALWRARAIHESERATARGCRTWFGTLTWAPARHYEAECAIRGREPHFEGLAEPEKLRFRTAEMAREATLWLKRVRKNSGAPIRYLLVSEVHTGSGENAGMPHLHVLMHEVDPAHQVTKVTLQNAWHGGFSQFKLCRDARGAMYLTKYLTKAIEARVRASIDYGDCEAVGSQPT